jgi:hypothetical protein
MKPADKASELLEKYLSIEDSEAKNGGNLMFINEAKQCALIVVDEVIDTGCLIEVDFKPLTEQHLAYWQEVKKEIEKL